MSTVTQQYDVDFFGNLIKLVLFVLAKYKTISQDITGKVSNILESFLNEISDRICKGKELCVSNKELMQLEIQVRTYLVHRYGTA